MQEENLQGYVEKIGLLAEKYELPRMAGRILGWLLVLYTGTSIRRADDGCDWRQQRDDQYDDPYAVEA